MTLWIRGLIFSILVPGAVAFYGPWLIDPHAHFHGGICDAGWLLIAAGTLIYALCLIRFLAAGGTPAIYFTRPLRFLLGEEPTRLVAGGLYRYSRNPMYLGMLSAVFGQAMLFASPRIVEYGCVAFVFFHVAIIFIEEPHLRATRGASYEQFCRDVPRWL